MYTGGVIAITSAVWFVASLPSGSFGLMMVSVLGFFIATCLIGYALFAETDDDRTTKR